MANIVEAQANGLGWPTARSSKSGILAQFGSARADLMDWALTTGDPLADAVVAEIHEHGREVRVALATGIAGGLAAVADPPPAVAALLAQTETAPSYVDDELLDTGSLAYFSSPPPAHAISLSAGALVRVYDSPSIATVLATTGKLIDGVGRRLEETGKWVNTAMIPGSLRIGEPGYVATLQVRMLHAQMRRLARERDYDEAAHGAPINQVDLARTWMDFTLTSYRAEAVLGFGLTSTELAALYRYWWYVAHLLGLDARLVEGIADHDSASRVDDLLQAVTGPPTQDSAALAAATLRSIAGTLNELMSVPEGMALHVLNALTRRFHGDDLADELRIPAAPAANAVLNPAIHAIKARRAKLRANPSGWRQAQTKNIAQATEMTQSEAEQAQYQG